MDESNKRTSLSPRGCGRDNNRISDEDEEDDDNESGMAVLPTDAPTIKTVVSSSPSPESPTNRRSGFWSPTSRESSPNVVPLGPPSSPSANCVRLGNSSSSVGSAERASSVISMNSLGTVVRHPGASPWIRDYSSTRSLSPARSTSRSSRSPSRRSWAPSPGGGSIPPVPSIPSIHSASSPISRPHAHSFGSSPPLPLNPAGHARSRSTSGGTAASIVTSSDVRAVVDRGILIQYPKIRGPSGSSQQAATEYSDATQLHYEHVGPHHDRNISGASSQAVPSSEMDQISMVREDDSDERGEGADRVASLIRPGNPAVPSSTSSLNISRSTSERSVQRPGTGTSSFIRAAPTWAKAYYRNGKEVINEPASPMKQQQQPPSPTTPIIESSPQSNNAAEQYNIPPIVSQPETPMQKMSNAMQESKTNENENDDEDPRDPRSHWVRGATIRQVSDQTNNNNAKRSSPLRSIRSSWSPHLFPDRTFLEMKRGKGGLMSMDSFYEPTFGRRNIQIYCFCLGFIMPIGKFIPFIFLFFFFFFFPNFSLLLYI